MKRILVVKGHSAYNVLRYAADAIGEGFCNAGYQVDMIDTQEDRDGRRLFHCLEQPEEYEFYFSMQGIAWEQECNMLPQLQNIRRVGWLVDDPVFHAGRLIESTGKNAYVLTVQDTFTQRIQTEYPKFEKVRTLYHGGFTGQGSCVWSEKDISVFFSGSYTTLEHAAQKIEEIEGAFGVVAGEVKQRILEDVHGLTWDRLLRQYLQEIGFQTSREEFCALLQLMYPLDQYQRSFIRKNMIETLLRSGITISVVGKGWNEYEGRGIENLNIVSTKGVDITEVIRLMQRSKIILHNINFDSGMHERIFTAMLANSVCVTNEYELLKHFFTNGKEMLMFPMNQMEQLPEIIKDLLGKPKLAEEIAMEGCRVALEKHTWQRRGEQIAKWMEDEKDFTY